MNPETGRVYQEGTAALRKAQERGEPLIRVSHAVAAMTIAGRRALRRQQVKMARAAGHRDKS